MTSVRFSTSSNKNIHFQKINFKFRGQRNVLCSEFFRGLYKNPHNDRIMAATRNGSFNIKPSGKKQLIQTTLSFAVTKKQKNHHHDLASPYFAATASAISEQECTRNKDDRKQESVLKYNLYFLLAIFFKLKIRTPSYLRHPHVW